MFETILRSGVPPHMGQFPVPGSPARMEGEVATARTSRMPPIRKRLLMIDIPFRTSVRRQGEIIQIRAELGIEEESWCTLTIADRINSFKRPGRRFGFPNRPRLALNAHTIVRHVLHAKLQPVPGVGLPGEIRLNGARGFRFPGLNLQLLRGSIKNQRITLRSYSDVAHLPATLRSANIRLERVVRQVCGANEDASPFEDGVIGSLLKNLLAIQGGHRNFACLRLHPTRRDSPVGERREGLCPRQRMNDARPGFASNAIDGCLNQSCLSFRIIGHDENTVSAYRALQAIERPRWAFFTKEQPFVVEESRLQIHPLTRFENQFGGYNLQKGWRTAPAQRRLVHCETRGGFRLFRSQCIDGIAGDHKDTAA